MFGISIYQTWKMVNGKISNNYLTMAANLGANLPIIIMI